MCPSTRSTMQRTCTTEGAETTINTSSTRGNLLYNLLTLQNRAGLCLSQLISPLPLTQYWTFYCIDIYKLLRGPASQTVPVRYLISNALLFKSADQRYNFRASSHSVRKDVSAIAATELIYCTDYVCIFKRMREHPCRRYVTFSLICLNSPHPEEEAI